ncbi:MAG TPA: hypothetical protein VGE93_10095 [Bryobacteraceae bacterium]
MPLNRKLAILGRLLEPGDSLAGMLHFTTGFQMLERYQANEVRHSARPLLQQLYRRGHPNQ